MNKKELALVERRLAHGLLFANPGDTPEFLLGRVLKGLNSAQRQEVRDYISATSKVGTEPETGKAPAVVAEQPAEEQTDTTKSKSN